MRLLKSLTMIALLLAIPLLAAGIDGHWKGPMPSRDGNTREVSFHFKSNGAVLTGTVIGPMGRDVEIQDGKISGNAISFFVSMDLNGSAVKVQYAGQLTGDDLKMKMQREGTPRSVEFALKKAGE